MAFDMTIPSDKRGPPPAGGPSLTARLARSRPKQPRVAPARRNWNSNQNIKGSSCYQRRSEPPYARGRIWTPTPKSVGKRSAAVCGAPAAADPRERHI